MLCEFNGFKHGPDSPALNRANAKRSSKSSV